MELRKQNVYLIIIGYSFQDAHINRVIEEAIQVNSNLHVIIVNQSIHEADPALQLSDLPLRQKLFVWANQTSRITLIGMEFQHFIECLPEAKAKTPAESEHEIFRQSVDGN
jgi:hypothetical protein